MPLDIDKLVQTSASAYSREAKAGGIAVSNAANQLVDTLNEQRKNADRFADQKVQLIESFQGELKAKTAETKAEVALNKNASTEVRQRIESELLENKRLLEVKDNGNIFQKMIATVKMGVNESQIREQAKIGIGLAQNRASAFREISSTASELYTTQYEQNWNKIAEEQKKWAEIERVDTKLLGVITQTTQNRKQDLYRDWEFAKDARAEVRRKATDLGEASNPITAAFLEARGMVGTPKNLQLASYALNAIASTDQETWKALVNMTLVASEKGVSMSQMATEIPNMPLDVGLALANVTGQTDMTTALEAGRQSAIQAEYARLSDPSNYTPVDAKKGLTKAEADTLQKQAVQIVNTQYTGTEALGALKKRLEGDEVNSPSDSTFSDERAFATFSQAVIKNNPQNQELQSVMADQGFYTAMVQPSVSSADREGASAVSALEYIRENHPQIKDPIGVVADIFGEYGKRYAVNQYGPAVSAFAKSGMPLKPQVKIEIRPSGLGDFFGTPNSRLDEAAKGKYNLADKNDLYKYIRVQEIKANLNTAQQTISGVRTPDDAILADTERSLRLIQDVRGNK